MRLPKCTSAARGVNRLGGFGRDRKSLDSGPPAATLCRRRCRCSARRGGRAVECGGLLSRCTGLHRYPGFESQPLRQNRRGPAEGCPVRKPRQSPARASERARAMRWPVRNQVVFGQTPPLTRRARRRGEQEPCRAVCGRSRTREKVGLSQSLLGNDSEYKAPLSNGRTPHGAGRRMQVVHSEL